MSKLINIFKEIFDKLLFFLRDYYVNKVKIEDGNFNKAKSFAELNEKNKNKLIKQMENGWEEAPYPIGGMSAIMKNLRHPTDKYSELKYGKVVLKISIADDGAISNIQIQETIDENYSQMAIDAVKKAKFKPARNKDGNTNADLLLPIMFQ